MGNGAGAPHPFFVVESNDTLAVLNGNGSVAYASSTLPLNTDTVVRVEYDQGISEIRLYVDGVLQTQTSNSIADMASTFPTSTFSCGYTSVVGWPAYVGAVYSNVRVFYESPPAENRVQQSNGADAYTWFALGDNTVRLQVPGGTLVTPASQTPIPVEQWARVFVESDHVTDTLKVHVDDNASTPEASSAATSDMSRPLM